MAWQKVPGRHGSDILSLKYKKGAVLNFLGEPFGIKWAPTENSKVTDLPYVQEIVFLIPNLK